MPYTTEGGVKVHADVDCWALVNGQATAEAEGKRPHAVDRTAFVNAIEDGRDPCKHCYPHSSFDGGRWSPGPPADYDVTKSLSDQPLPESDPWSSSSTESDFAAEPPF